MLEWALGFFVIAIIGALFGFRAIARAALCRQPDRRVEAAQV
jgi:uncharacterized membrane protein YtjA (UPF0391 family)